MPLGAGIDFPHALPYGPRPAQRSFHAGGKLLFFRDGDKTAKKGAWKTMKLNITGKQIDLGEALRTHITERLNNAVTKYYERAVEGQVTITPEAHLFVTEVSVHVGTGISASAKAEEDEVYLSVNSAIEKLEKQLRRDKRKRRNHHNGHARGQGHIPAEEA